MLKIYVAFVKDIIRDEQIDSEALRISFGAIKMKLQTDIATLKITI